MTRKGTPDLHEGGHIGQLEIRYTRITHYLFGFHLVGNVTLKSHLIDYSAVVCTLKARLRRMHTPESLRPSLRTLSQRICWISELLK